MKKPEIVKIKFINIILIFSLIILSCYKNNYLSNNIKEKTDNIEFIHSNDLLWAEMKILDGSINIDFSLYPTLNIWDKKECMPVLDTELKLRYQTVITNASKLEPNFDGKYRITSFGYGSSAQYFFIIDLNNGNVFEGRVSSFGIKYNVNSSLIIINPIENMYWEEIVPEWSTVEYIRWNGDRFIGLVKLNYSLE
ncbi:MAG: hypothetical protein FWD28_01155 [Treponema sp.]|nr:hypothetical protein [Treponema sp.]